MEITKIIYNEVKHETTVYFKNGDSVKVKKSKDTEHDLYSAVSAAIVKYIYGSNTAFKKQLKNAEVINDTRKDKVLADVGKSIFDTFFRELLEERHEKVEPHNFKIGDKVKFGSSFFTNGGVGVVVDFDKRNINSILVQSKDIMVGHTGGIWSHKKHYTYDHLWFEVDELELIEKPKPHKFKVGDKVKFDSHFSHIKQKGIGEIVEVDDSFITTYLVRSDDIVEGHDGNGLEEGNHTGCNHWWLFKDDLKLIEEPKQEAFVEGEVVWYEDNVEKHYSLVRIEVLYEFLALITYVNAEFTFGCVPLEKLTRKPKYKSYTKD